MKKYGLLAKVYRSKRYSGIAQATYRYTDKLERRFKCHEPNQKWVTDITQFTTKGGILYMSVVKDLYDGFIVGAATAKHNRSSMVIDTVSSAISQLSYDEKSNLLIHSDQGTQYTSLPYHKLLSNHDIEPSMSRPGRPIDNAPIESFFSSMKTEWVNNTKKMNMDEVIDLVGEYIEFYNYSRIRLDSGTAPFEKRKSYYKTSQSEPCICP